MVLQPDRWELHPEDFRARMNWERERQRVLDAQAKAIQEKLPEPTDRIPPIPALKHPDWHLRHRIKVVPTVTEEPTVTAPTVTEAPTVTATVTRSCEVCGKPIDGKARYCSGACRVRAHRDRSPIRL